jgi:hypothetical protein
LKERLQKEALKGFALAHPCNCIFEIREAVILSRIFFFVVGFRGFSVHVIKRGATKLGLARGASSALF